MSEKEKDIAIIGAEKTGKTAIVKQLKFSTFDEKYEPTFDDVYCVKFDYNDKKVDLCINDTSGSMEHIHIRHAIIKKCDGIIAVFSITDEMSYLRIQKIIDLSYQLKQTRHVPIVLVGCKLDLAFLREVETKTAEAYAQHNNIPFIEITANNHDDVVKVFTTLLEEMDKPEKALGTNEPVFEKQKVQCCTVL